MNVDRADPFRRLRLDQGRVLREPPGKQSGYWAGAPGVYYAREEAACYLTYRLRRPRGVAPDRGGEAKIARSTNLIDWQDIWTVTKDQFRSASIERCALRQDTDGQWHYFASFVDPADGRWCVWVASAASIRDLDPCRAKPLFTAAQFGLEGVKDPWICERNGVYHMLLSVAVKTTGTRAESHATLDIFNTGECVSATGLALSRDLSSWEWQGVIFAPADSGWDAYCRRINSFIPRGNSYLGFYDGSASHAENYEERTGLASSFDSKSWKCLTPDRPLLISPHASGSLRYLDAQTIGEEVLFFYEFARPDGAHDLRLSRMPLVDWI